MKNIGMVLFLASAAISCGTSSAEKKGSKESATREVTRSNADVKGLRSCLANTPSITGGLSFPSPLAGKDLEVQILIVKSDGMMEFGEKQNFAAQGEQDEFDFSFYLGTGKFSLSVFVKGKELVRDLITVVPRDDQTCSNARTEERYYSLGQAD